MTNFTKCAMAVAVLPLVLLSCSDDDGPNPPADIEITLNPSQADYKFPYVGGDYSVKVTLTGAEEWNYDVKQDTDWLDSERDGNTIEFAASVNQSLEKTLEATVTVTVTKPETSDPKSVSFKITQEPRQVNSYERLLGKWELWSDKWIYSWPDPDDYYDPVTEYLFDTDATHLAFTLEIDEEGKSYKVTTDYLEEFAKIQYESAEFEDIDIDLIFNDMIFLFNGDGTLDWVMDHPVVLTDYGDDYVTNAYIMILDAQSFAGDNHSMQNLTLTVSEDYKTMDFEPMMFEVDGNGEIMEGSVQLGLGTPFSFWGFNGYAEVSPWYFVTGDKIRFVKVE